MLSINELIEKIKRTTLEEAITLFKERVLKRQLEKYDIGICKQEFKEIYKNIDYDGSFFFFVEPDLGSSRGGVSDCINEKQEKIALLLLMVEVRERYLDVNVGIEDWLGRDCIFCDFVVSNTAAAKPLTQEEYQIVRDRVCQVIDRFVPSMTVMDTWEYEEFKQGQSPDETKIDNVQITLPLLDKREVNNEVELGD